MSDGDWYEIVHGDDLRQGDLLIDCPVFTLSGEAGYPLPPDDEPVIQAESYDLVIMTQSCDIAGRYLERRNVSVGSMSPLAAPDQSCRI